MDNFNEYFGCPARLAHQAQAEAWRAHQTSPTSWAFDWPTAEDNPLVGRFAFAQTALRRGRDSRQRVNDFLAEFRSQQGRRMQKLRA